jgi:L-rhamnose mutarotase
MNIVIQNWLTTRLKNFTKNIPRKNKMEKYAWKAKIVDGTIDEYIRRHDEIWDEMKEVLQNAGIVNYTIWNVGNELFGYYECEKGIEYATKVQAQSPIVDKWNEYMKDILIMEMDPITGAQPQLKKVFSFKEK